MATYRIHPGIGIARLGNSDTDFYLAPETPAGLPLDCDATAITLSDRRHYARCWSPPFATPQGRIKRQAARFQVFVYDEQSPEGRPLKIGDQDRRRRQRWHADRHPLAGLRRKQEGVLVPIRRVRVGEHGYPPGSSSPQPRRPRPQSADHRPRPADCEPATSAARRSTAAAKAVTRLPFRRHACRRFPSIRWARLWWTIAAAYCARRLRMLGLGEERAAASRIPRIMPTTTAGMTIHPTVRLWRGW